MSKEMMQKDKQWSTKYYTENHIRFIIYRFKKIKLCGSGNVWWLSPQDIFNIGHNGKIL
jgi:hypothetical protein